MVAIEAGTTDTADARLQALVERFAPDDQKFIRAVRARLRERLPTANELAYDYGTFFVIAYAPTERPTEGIVSFAARPDGVRLYLMGGPRLPDPGRLLIGTGKQVRFLRLASAEQLSHPDVEALITAAIAMAPVPLPATGHGSLIIKTFGGKSVPRRKPAS